MKKPINIHFKYDHPAFKNRIDYVLDFIENHPLAGGKIHFSSNDQPESDLQIAYGLDFPNAFYIPQQKIFFNTTFPDIDSLASNDYLYQGQRLHSIESGKHSEQDFLKGQDFQFDLIETIFFHISRLEEWFYTDGKEDQHGRMDEQRQFLVRHGLHQKPVVDHLVLCFLKALDIKVEDQKTTYRITHDIDFIVRRNDFFGLLKSIGGAILKQQDIEAALRIWQNRHEKNPYDTFDWMLLKEENIEKVIYFLVDGRSAYDDPYDLDLPEFIKAVKLSKERGYRIGIHPSYDSWKSAAMIMQEREKLQNTIHQEVLYIRQHFLRFSLPHTTKIIEELGFKEDSSLGYANRIGFRCGTGFAYHLYDFEQEKAFDFLETPLILMDSALLAESDHHPQKVQDIFATFLSENRWNTKITFNFHNSRFYDASLKGVDLKALYLSIINR